MSVFEDILDVSKVTSKAEMLEQLKQGRAEIMEYKEKMRDCDSAEYVENDEYNEGESTGEDDDAVDSIGQKTYPKCL